MEHGHQHAYAWKAAHVSIGIIHPSSLMGVANAQLSSAPYQSLTSSAYCDPFVEELSLNHYDPSLYTELSLAAASAPGAFHTSSTPSTPTPSPFYFGRDIIPKDEIMEIGHLQPTSPQSMYATPLSTPGASGRTRCQWKDCTIELDDLSHSGIRRHFRDYHNMPRGSMIRCEWGSNCRSEEMLYDNIAKHIAECHLKSMRTACKSCGNSFARNDTLKRHLNAGCPALQRQG